MLWLAAAVIAALCLLALGFLQARTFRMQTVRFADPRIPEGFVGFRIAQVSDYHDSRYRSHGRMLADAITAQRPDIIVLTGDLFERRRPDACAHAFAFVERAVRIAPVFFVEGNHERRIPCYPQWRRRLIELGVIVLENESVTWYRNGDAMRVVGLLQVFDTDTLRLLCRGDALSLVLSHRCELASQYAAAGNALVLSGHAHGGQVRLLGRGVFAPDQGLFPRYAAGRHRAGDAVLFVSRGIGNSVPAPRLFNTPEWNLFMLSRETDQGR